MRIFGVVDGLINRFDRAEWLTPPFDGNLERGVVLSGDVGFLDSIVGVTSNSGNLFGETGFLEELTGTTGNAPGS